MTGSRATPDEGSRRTSFEPSCGADDLAGIAAVVLAAGAASRFGRPKQVLFVNTIIARIEAAGVDAIVVVSGAHALTAPAPVVHCRNWESGPGASLRCGLAALPSECRAAVVVLADGPNISPESIRRVVRAGSHRPGRALAASYERGVRSHPVLLPRSVWEAIPDEGARALNVDLVDCGDLEPPGDVDYAHELDTLRQRRTAAPERAQQG